MVKTAGNMIRDDGNQPVIPLFSFVFFSQVGIKKNLANRMFVGKQHGQTVDAGAEAAVGGHTVGHGAYIVLVDRVPLFIVTTE